MGRLHKHSFGPIMLLLAVVAIAPGVSIVAGLLLMIPAPQMIAVFGLITGATNQGGAMHFPKSSNDGVRPDWLVTILTRHPAASAAEDPVKASCVVRKSLDAASSNLRKLPIAQGHCVVLDVRQNTPDVSRFLCSHSAVLVEIEWLVTHEARRHQCAERQPNRPG